MHGDFSRLTFDPAKRFSAVLSLQGRVHMDADANEQTAILLYYLRTLTVDVLGKRAWPEADPGFGITRQPANGKLKDLEIGFGRCYVDGLLVENVAEGQPTTTYYQQPDAHFDEEHYQLPKAPFFVFLRVSESLVTYVESPAIRDVALGAGGPDASARLKVTWQVLCEAQEGPALSARAAALEHWEKKVEPRLARRADDHQPGLLSAQEAPGPGKDDELCALAPEAGYRGMENQLYRVEIHRGGRLGGDDKAAWPTFKCSRDNGSVVFPIAGWMRDELVTVTTLGRDDRFGLEIGDWVEIVDDASASNGHPDLNGNPSRLHQVKDVDPVELRVALDAAPENGTGSDSSRHPFLRRWDHQDRPDLDLDDGAVLVRDADWIELEDGVQIRFHDGGEYRPGDFWMIPARVETGKVEWPTAQDGAIASPPHGVDYHYAPLAYVRANANPIDLRCVTPALECKPV